MTFRTGTFTNGKGASVEVVDIQLPGSPTFDGGAHGVTVRNGRRKWFVMARDWTHFWSQFPYSICAPADVVQP